MVRLRNLQFGGCGQHVFPGLRFGKIVGGKQILPIKEELRIADVRQRIEFAGLVGIPANVQTRFYKVGVRLRQFQQLTVRNQPRKPRIVHHNDVVGAGVAGQIQGELFKEV